MIEYKTGNIFHEKTDAIVNTVNCVGAMGRGLALQFKNAYPKNFSEYAAACRRSEVVPGKMFVHHAGGDMPPYFIINFPTKRHWREKSHLEDIEAGLADLVRAIRENDITSIAIPPLGCGLGGLSWPMVKALIENRLACLEDVRIVLLNQ